MKTSVDVLCMTASISSAKDSITFMKASIEDFVEITSMEAFAEVFVEAPVEITCVEDFISFIPSMEASTEASSKAFVEDASLKAFSTYAKTSITSMKSSVEDFVEVTPMESFVKLSWKPPWKLLL